MAHRCLQGLVKEVQLLADALLPLSSNDSGLLPGFRRGRLVWGAPLSSGFPPLLVMAIAARRVDRPQIFEIELGGGLQLVGQSRSFEVLW